MGALQTFCRLNTIVSRSYATCLLRAIQSSFTRSHKQPKDVWIVLTTWQ